MRWLRKGGKCDPSDDEENGSFSYAMSDLCICAVESLGISHSPFETCFLFSSLRVSDVMSEVLNHSSTCWSPEASTARKPLPKIIIFI